jgi:hypothetical protein
LPFTSSCGFDPWWGRNHHAPRGSGDLTTGNYWALAVALPAERIEEMIGEVVLPEEERIATTVPAAQVAADEPISRER